MTYIKKLPSIEEVKKQYPLSSELAQARIQRIEQIKNMKLSN